MTGRTRLLAALSPAELDELMVGGRCPHLADLDGAADGEVLTSGVVRALKVWRGKTSSVDEDAVVGTNRLALGLLGFRRFRFVARPARSSFSGRTVLRVDHDLPGNPGLVRRFHDELVQIEPGLVLATSHYRVRGRLRFAAHFALDFGTDDAPT